MALESLMNDKITIVKKDGTITKENVKANVSSGKITTFDVKTPIDIGDHILRTIGNGNVEDYIVEDPVYMAGLGGAIPPSYQLKVRRSAIPTTDKQTVIGNITAGANSRIYINSTDNSVSVTQFPAAELDAFATLLENNLEAFSEKQRIILKHNLERLKNEIKSPTQSSSTVKGILNSIKAVAEGAAGNLVASGVILEVTKLITTIGGN